MLVLHRLEIRVSGRIVLRHASVSAHDPGVLFLVGPGGAGKSTLLLSLSRQGADATYAGMATLDGLPLRLLPYICHVPQHAGLPPTRAVESQPAAPRGAQPGSRVLKSDGAPQPPRASAAAFDASLRRMQRVLSALATPAPLYLIDEPTAGMVPEHEECIRERLKLLARQACVVVATHNRKDCLALGGRTALIAGNTVQECADTRDFFSAPATDAGRTYVATGNCGLPSRPGGVSTRDGIWWLVPGLLAGLSRPGLMADAAMQAKSLRESGIEVMVGLEESVPPAAARVRDSGIEYLHVPVPDMAPPSFSQAVDLCRLLEPRIRENRGVALHCRGGLGRTGTALAALLIWFGDDPDVAINHVRAAKPHAIQTVAQSRFLRDFSSRIRGWH